MILGIDIDDTISNTCDVMFTFAQEYVINVLNKEPLINESPCNTHFYMRHLHGFNEQQDEEFLKLYYAKILKELREDFAANYGPLFSEQSNCSKTWEWGMEPNGWGGGC